jgi:hypothetical protein
MRTAPRSLGGKVFQHAAVDVFQQFDVRQRDASPIHAIGC